MRILFDSVRGRQNCTKNALLFSRKGPNFYESTSELSQWLQRRGTYVLCFEKTPSKDWYLVMARKLHVERKFESQRRKRRPRVSDERIEEVRKMFSDDPCLSIHTAISALNIPVTKIHRILCYCPYLFPCRLQNLHLKRQSDREDRLRFSDYCQNSEFLSRIAFTEECIFRLNGHVIL